MAFFKQLRLLLKHKILLRRRQPTTLILELFWPAFVFLTILVARWHFPPTFKETCYYQSKALPSAGLVNLLQSYVCNVDNQCVSRNDYQEVPNYPNASIHGIVDQLLPLLTDKNVTTVINDLPKGVRLIAAIIDTLSEPSIQKLLESGFPLRQMLRPTGWLRIRQELLRLESNLVPFYDIDLVNYYQPNDDYHNESSFSSSSSSSSSSPLTTYDILVNANLNLMQFGIHSDGSNSSFQSFRSFRDVICDHSELEKFLILPPQTKSYRIRLLSRRLCLLELKDLYHLFDLIQDNIDFGNILEKLSLIFHSVGLNEHQKHLDNIIAMIGTIDRANLFPSMSALRNTSWMYDVPSLFEVLRSGEIDVGTLLKIINDIEPIFNVDDSLMQSQHLNELRQRQRIEYLMHLYDSDDSTLKSVTDSALNDDSPSSSSTSGPDESSDYLYDQDDNSSSGNDTADLGRDYGDRIQSQHKQMTILQSIDDLEASESSASGSTVSGGGNVDLLSIATTNYPNDSLGRKFLPKLLANMDKFIDGAEKFTRTPQWTSLLSAFQGLQVMLEMADSGDSGSRNQLSSTNIEKFILNFPKNIQALNNFFNSIVPEKFQPLVFPLFNLLQRIADSTLQHLSGAFTRALNEDKIYYFDKLAQMLIASLNNGTLPRKCYEMQRAMCDFETFQSVFIKTIDEDTGEETILVDEDPGTLQGIQELGCIFFGQNYLQQNVEESTPILAKLYYTLSMLNDTNQLSSSLASLAGGNSTTKSSDNDNNVFWNNFTSRMLEVYLLATKSVPAHTWSRIINEMNFVWKRNRLFDRIILSSRVLQLTANCFIPERIMQSPIYLSIQRKNIIVNEILNLVLDEINQAVEAEQVKVQQLAMGSPTLQRFFEKNLHVLPILMDSVFDTIFLNLPRFVERMFQFHHTFVNNWPCNRFSLVDMLMIQNDQHRRQIYEMEDFLCRQFQMNEGERGRIIDELIAPGNNQSRGAPLIRVLQNKSNNLSMIYEHVPPLDWVEAATSVSAIKESAEKLIFADSSMIWFPEIDNLDDLIRDAANRGRSAFVQFYNQGTAGLFTYFGDIVTPFAIRYMTLNETFNDICDGGVSDLLMAPVYNEKEWRCFFVSLKYASYSMQYLLELINDVMKNLLDQQRSSPEMARCQLLNVDDEESNHLLFLVDHIPEMVELIMNKVLLGNQDITGNASLHHLICQTNLDLDIFGSRRQQYADVRKSLCQLGPEMSRCFQLVMPDRWTAAFDHLNQTWYSQSLVELSNKSAFVDAYHSVYQFLSLFGQFSPRFVNRLMARIQGTTTNNSSGFLPEILGRLARSEHFRNGRRFAYVMQSAGPDLHKAIFDSDSIHGRNHEQERRDLIMALIYAFNELPIRLRQRYKIGGIQHRESSSETVTGTTNNNNDDLLQVDLLDSLLDWFDSHLLVVTETFMQTIALDTQRLAKLFQNKFDTVTVWRAFCRAPVSQYFVVDNQISVSANKAKDEICQMDFNSVYHQWFRQAKPFLQNYTNQELIEATLIRAGTILDLIVSDTIYKRDLLKWNEWQPIVSKLNRLVADDSEENWIIPSVARFLQEFLPPAAIETVHSIIQRWRCSMDIVPVDGLGWDTAPQVYQNKTDVMAFYSTLNSAFTLASVALNTFLTQQKFYNHLQMYVRYGKKGFCMLETDPDFSDVFAILPQSSANEIVVALRNLQIFICNESSDFIQQLNPVSQCFSDDFHRDSKNFADDLASLADRLRVMSRRKNEITTDHRHQYPGTVPPIADIRQWNRFLKWWREEVGPYPNSGRTLLAMRVFQMIDVFADQHVLWKAIYRLTHITSEMFAYSLRALQLTDSMYPMKPEMKFTLNDKNKVSSKISSSASKKRGLSSLLTSTVSKLIFPEVNHFITFATFRQLRWIRHISHFFAQHPDILHDELCPTLNGFQHQRNNDSVVAEPVIVDEDFNDLLLLLCHNHPSDWVYSLTFKSNLFNIKPSKPRPKFISHRKIRERIGKLTQVLAKMLDYNSDKNNQKLDHVVRFLKMKQLESIENVAGTGDILLETIMAAQNRSQSSLTFKELLKTSWRSVPALLETMDQYICSYKISPGKNRTATSSDMEMEFSYRPRAPDMKVVMCEMPRWNFDQAYSYLSKHLDLKNMLLVFASADMVTTNHLHESGGNQKCVTPLRFLSRWIDVGQDIFGQMYRQSFWSELKSCRKRHLISLLASTKSSNTFLLRHSLRYVRFMNKLLTTIDKFSHENKGVSWNNVRQLWQTFSFFILNQVPAYVPITDIVRTDVNLSEYLNATLDRVSILSRSRAKQAIRLLTDSMLDINAIAWHNFSNIALKEMICKQQQTVKFLDSKNYYLPIIVKANIQNQSSSAAAEESLYETLCHSANLMPIIDSLMAVIDHQSIQSQLALLQRTELAKTNWLNDVLMPEMSEMVSSGMLADLGEKIGIIHNPNQIKTESSSQKGINHLLISFVSMTRAKNFNTLYNTIKQAVDKLSPRFNEGPIIDSLNRILEGLRSLKDLSNRGLFQIKYVISDLLLNAENVKIFLERNLGIDRSAINTIMNATIDLSGFIEMSARVSFDSSAFCNQTLLFDELKLELPEIQDGETVTPSREVVTNALCTLSITEDFKFNNQILNQLVIRKLTYNIVNLIQNGLLRKAKIETNQISKALQAIKASSTAMPQVKTFIRNLSSTFEQIDDFPREKSTIQNLTLSQASDLIGKIVCGGSSLALNRKFQKLKDKAQKPNRFGLTNGFNERMSGSDFCLDGYRQILEMQGGTVLWNAIKPILVGKILYTPKSPVTDQIMSQMNTTLKFMPRIIEMLHAWSQTLSSLETFYSNQSNANDRMNHVKHLIQSVFVNGEADGLFDDIDTFHLIERMTKSGNVLAMVKLIGQMAQCASFDRFVGLPDELELEEHARNLTRSHQFIAGIVFVGNRNDYQDRNTVPKNIQYKIRIDVDFVPSTKALKARIWEPGPRDDYANDLQYLHGFVQIQEMIDRAIMTFLTNRTALPIDPEVHLQQQPYLCYGSDKYGNYIRSLAPLITTMAWIFLIAHLIREHVLERELHLEEVMRVMGLKSGVAWLTWFIIGISVMAFATISGILLLYLGHLIPASDPILLFLFFMVFNVSLLMFCYMISSFFRTATIAALSGIVAYLASFLPFMVAITLENEMSFAQKIFTCFSMSTSFCFGMMYMTRFEVQGVGMQWNNLWHSPMQGDTMNVGTAMIMMAIDSCIYFLIAWYISHVHPPGNNARRYSFLFFLSYSYWKNDFLRSFGFGEDKPQSLAGAGGLAVQDQESLYSSPSNSDNKEKAPSTSSSSSKPAIDTTEDDTSAVLENDGTFNIVDPEEWKSLSGKGFFSFVSDDNNTMIADGTLKTISGTLKKAFIENHTLTRKASNQSSSSASTLSQSTLGMEINGLYVIYNERSNKSKHIAVSNLNMSLKEGQITTILGRNGAGKTTTINVLTGQMPPTSGTVNIYGYRIPDDFSYARRLLGYCPQYNTLFNDLTVREHLVFFAELKGLLQDPKLIQNDVDEILQNMGLWNLQHQLAKHLSGGLKRRLCVALAFVGGSKLIILDEPTASVDPVARRRIWDLIVQQKRSRTILLTTHHMDEAEILSDEVAVIYRGKLLCIGSPLLLKSKYGCGYRLTVSRQGRSDSDSLEEIVLDSIQEPVQDPDPLTEYNSMDSRITIRPRSDVERLMAFTKCLIPNASFVEDNNGEVVLSLPQYDDHGSPHDYATFFRCFDSNIRTLGFGSYGVTSTTLEEVFLTLCSLEELNMPVDEAKLAVARRLSYSTGSIRQPPTTTASKRRSTGGFTEISMMSTTTVAAGSDRPVSELIMDNTDTGFRLKSRQLYALFSKRFLHMIRDWKLLFCTLFLPCLFIAFAMAMTLIKPSFAPDPALPLVPHIYGHSTVSFLHNHPKHGNYTEKFHQVEQELMDPKEYPVDCLAPREKWRTAKCPILRENKFESALPVHLITLNGKAWDRNSRTSCKCDECFLDIKTMSHFIPLPLNTGYGWVYNLSRLIEVNQFLLRTQPEFMDRRWGGWSFRSVRPQRPHQPKRRVAKVWYDNNGFHSMPAYLNALNNALLRANLRTIKPEENGTDYRITTYSHPLHVRSNQLGDQSVMQQAGDAGIAIIILVGFIFIPTSFVFYIVRERICEEKHLQKTFGVGPLLYWLSSLLWDVTILVIAIGFASAIIAFFRIPIYMSRLNLPAVLTLLFFFGWAMINLVYLMEKFFDEPSLAFMGIYCLALFIGIHTMVMRLMIDVFKLIEITPTIYQIFERVAVFFPPYLLLSGIVDVHRNQLFADIFTLFDQDTYVNPFSWELLGKHYTIFAVQGIVFFLLNLAIECDILQMIIRICRQSPLVSKFPPVTEMEDSDVAEERRRVHQAVLEPNSSGRSSKNSGSESDSNCSTGSYGQGMVNDILRVLNVTKVYKSMFGYRCAVNNITFSVPRGECFGLLGVNGAGKTTLFRIITGQVKATTGQLVFNGRTNGEALTANNYQNQAIGYCPQADALDNFLTPIEHLTIYAHLRGLPRHQIPKIVRESIDKFQLQTHSTMPVQALSRGNRRKLCLAVAMIGRPQLILLDEPTSGLDPQSRRHVCQNIQDAIRDHRSILLTSHSMEECDKLCSRLAIMVNGRFKCIGSPQYLKHKFGTGYIITLRLSEMKSNFKEAVEFVREHFPQSILRAHHHTMLEFNLPTNEIVLSTIFEVLQKAQSVLSLQDYSVSQTTLDQVFVSFASQQVNDYDNETNYPPTAKSRTGQNNNNNNHENQRQSEVKKSLFRSSIDHRIKRHASLLMSLCRDKRARRTSSLSIQKPPPPTNLKSIRPAAPVPKCISSGNKIVKNKCGTPPRLSRNHSFHQIPPDGPPPVWAHHPHPHHHHPDVAYVLHRQQRRKHHLYPGAPPAPPPPPPPPPPGPPLPPSAMIPGGPGLLPHHPHSHHPHHHHHSHHHHHHPHHPHRHHHHHHHHHRSQPQLSRRQMKP